MRQEVCLLTLKNSILVQERLNWSRRRFRTMGRKCLCECRLRVCRSIRMRCVISSDLYTCVKMTCNRYSRNLATRRNRLKNYACRVLYRADGRFDVFRLMRHEWARCQCFNEPQKSINSIMGLLSVYGEHKTSVYI